MGILRATKYKTLLKLSAAVFVLSAVIAANLAPAITSADAPTSAKPIISWADKAHVNAVDNKGNVYWAVNYVCSTSGALIDMATQTISQDIGVTTNATLDVLATTDGATSGLLGPTTSGTTYTKPACSTITSVGRATTSKVVPASYVWLSSGTPQFVLIVSSATNDTQLCPVDNKSCTAVLAKLDSTNGHLGTILFTKFTIPVDESKASLVAKDKGLVGTNGTVSPTCESGGFSLSWIMCPIINMLSSAVDNIYSSIIQPLLITKPISLDSNQYMYKIWSNFRVYGDIFLVIALLVVVFGQSIGGGLIDAYAAKKILPRLLLAAILINLSIYIVALAVDVTNIVGSGIQSLLSGPFKSAGEYTLTLNGGASATLTGLGIGAALTGTAGVWAIAAGGAAFLFPLLQFLLVFILMPAFFAFLALLAVIIVRQGLIILLVAVAPIAFALYCLPNTEQYFKKWWDLLFRALLVYPIIAVIFSIANILSVTISEASKAQGGILASLSQLMAIIALIVPLFLVAFAFKMAGGLLGKFHDVATGLHKKSQETIKGHANDPNSLRNKTRYGIKSAINDRRGVGYEALSKKTKAGSGGGRTIRRGLYKGAASMLNYGNLQAERAMLNKEQDEIAGAQYSQGPDGYLRALWAKKHEGPTLYATDENGNIKKDNNGNDVVIKHGGAWYSPYKELDGSYKEWSSSDVDKAKTLVARDPSRLQSFGKYELSKASDMGQLGEFKQRFAEVAQDYGWDDGQANAVWAGIKFAHQGSRKEQKYTDLVRSNGKLVWRETDHHGLSRELVDTMRTGDFASFRDTTGKEALDGWKKAKGRLANPSVYSKEPAPGERKHSQVEDEEIVRNYTALADHLERPLFGFGAGSEAQRQSMALTAAAQAADGESPDTTGYGLGSSKRAEDAWKDFVVSARSSANPNETSPLPDNSSVPPAN